MAASPRKHSRGRESGIAYLPYLGLNTVITYHTASGIPSAGAGGGEYWKSPADRHWQKFSQLSPVVDWDEVPTGIKALEIKWLLLSPIMCE